MAICYWRLLVFQPTPVENHCETRVRFVFHNFSDPPPRVDHFWHYQPPWLKYHPHCSDPPVTRLNGKLALSPRSSSAAHIHTNANQKILKESQDVFLKISKFVLECLFSEREKKIKDFHPKQIARWCASIEFALPTRRWIIDLNL